MRLSECPAVPLYVEADRLLDAVRITRLVKLVTIGLDQHPSDGRARGQAF